MKRSLCAVLVGLGLVAGSSGCSFDPKTSAAIGTEAKAMAPEIDTCKKRLKQLYDGWDGYRKAHAGKEPPSIDSLLPKYIKSPELMVCPTFERLKKAGRNISSGSIKFQGKDHLVTYGFKWLSAAGTLDKKRMGDLAPLITCPVHQEVIARFAFRKDPTAFELTDAVEKSVSSAGATAKTLCVRRNGEIGTVE
jgi:hypothetical protein